MSLAVDRDMIIDYVYNGEATVSTFVAPAMGHWVWDAAKESPLYMQNIEEARKLMEEAGYSKDNRLSITMAAGSARLHPRHRGRPPAAAQGNLHRRHHQQPRIRRIRGHLEEDEHAGSRL